MTIHIVGFSHTSFNADTYSACAFTAKTVRWTRILKKIGRDFTVYWGGTDNPEGVDLVTCFSDSKMVEHFGEWDPQRLPVPEWRTELPYWREFHQNVREELNKRLKPGDYIAIVGGAISQEIVDEFKNRAICIEPGVGYEGICRDTFACFESYAWMHHRYGAYGINDGRYFDAVIPNSYEPDDFYVAEPEGYAVFIGRMIQRKSPEVAALIAKHVGIPLKLAGAGVAHSEPGLIVCTDGTRIEGDVEYVGSVNPQERADLLAYANFMITPTRYIGPFEGVHVEALMSGVQPIAPDYGVFTESIHPTYRFRTIKEAVASAEWVLNSNSTEMRERRRERAIERFSLDVAAVKYDQWLARLDSLRGDGWYAV